MIKQIFLAILLLLLLYVALKYSGLLGKLSNLPAAVAQAMGNPNAPQDASQTR